MDSCLTNLMLWVHSHIGLDLSSNNLHFPLVSVYGIRLFSVLDQIQIMERSVNSIESLVSFQDSFIVLF